MGLDPDRIGSNRIESLDASCVSERERGKIQRYYVGAAPYAMNAIG